MGRARTWKLAGAGAAVAALGVGGVTAFGGVPSSASTAHKGPTTVGPRGRGPNDQGPPGFGEGTTLTFGATAPTNSGGTGGTGGAGASSTGTSLRLSSYEFAVGVGSGTPPASGGGTLAPNTLVVTTSPAAQSELTSLTGSAVLVARGGHGPLGLDMTFSGVTLQEYEMSSADGGSLTLVFGFTSATPATTTGVSNSSSSSTTNNSPNNSSNNSPNNSSNNS